ncbi:hypothetical protein MLD38_002643 [Melastoma candidum]|uniref:Uncharacterized protein n=1 Tax=Melastoma candidum TaxID=119954 RepID=A0ACB9S036_9MYRT|nr:hypothetical protein MLD38_002643 [Melastoma candidum]
MKAIGAADHLKSPSIIKTLAFISLSFLFFLLGKNFSHSSSYQRLLFFSSNSASSFSTSSTAAQSYTVALSPNLNVTFDPTLIRNHTGAVTPQADQGSSDTPDAADTLPLPPPPPPEGITRFGILDENGTMTDSFEVGQFDPEMVDDWRSGSGGNESDSSESDGAGASGIVKIKKYKICDESMREYIPCLDNVEAIKRLKSTEKGERFERHCLEAGKSLDCLVPAPKGYRPPIPWPRSRDEVWFSNVPHTRLVEDKGGQNWITQVKDKFKFPGGGTQFIHGADKYLDQISEMVPDITFGNHTRVVLDIGCGVASFGAYLLSRDVLTMSVAPKDVHENQIQFALERGVPAMVAAFATRRLLYPSQAFDLIHCSRCRINWTRDDGILLLELNRMLRAGGYFAWAAQPVYKHEPLLEEQWEEMLNLTTRLCWELVKKEGYVAMWRKPLNNSCYLSRDPGTTPPLCEPDDDPDNVWYVDLKACISRLPDNGYGANVSNWPARLHDPPDRLQSIQIDAYVSRNELYKAESNYWNEIIESYVRALHWKNMKLRNVLDMRAGYGGFAAALIDQKFNCWVLNVVPVSGPNTLPVIYDRGLLGVMHDWCEPFDTYPRTYDLLHANGLFSVERKRCKMSSIMLEMDRILRPGGYVYIRDSVTVMDELQAIAKAMGWHVLLRETSEGPHASYRILTCEKHLLRS